MTTQLKITNITVKTVIVPMDPPHRTASGEITVSPLVLVDIHAGSLVGHSIAFTYTPAALKPLAEFLLNLKPLLEGQPLAPTAIHELLQARFRIMGTQGLVGVALAAIDMACWDAQAKHQEVPLYQLLGGAPQAVKAYANVGFDGALECARQAEAFARQGFKAVKAKIGYATAAEDVNVVNAMRDAVGSDVELMIDYNQSLDPVTAISTLRVLDELGLSWIEEPVLAHDHQSSARVRDAIKTPIQGGENWWGPLDMQQALAAQATDYVMPDAQKIGGITGWLKSVALAEAHNVRVSSHLWPEVSAHLLAVGRTSHWLEYVDWWVPVLETPLCIENSHVVFDENQAGSGVNWRAEKVAEYLV